MANTTIPIHKLFRVYETLDQFDAEASHPENKICFIKDKRIIYANGVEYTNEQMYNDNITDDIKDAAKFKTVYNALLDELRNRNYMEIKLVPYIYWTGNSNTINISGTNYTAEPDKINIDGVEYYQLKLNKDLDNNFYQFINNTFSNLIFKDVDTSNVTNMNQMFSGCSTLTSLDASGFDTSNVTDMYYMFNNCRALTFLDVSGWNTGNVTNMLAMFQNCSSLTSLNVSGFDTSNVPNMTAMFYNCSSLTSLNVSGLNTSNVTNMTAMFYNCRALTFLDVSGWNTSNVTYMGGMFNNCGALTSLDLSGWNINNDTNMNGMFGNCSALKTIRMIGCSQTTIDKIKAQLSTDGITGCTIVTE